jgi:biopolymer transport protein ExbB
MNYDSSGLIPTLLSLPIFRAEWVLWLLILLSLSSVAVMVERFVFYSKHAIDAQAVRAKLADFLAQGDLQGAADYLEGYDSLETNTVLFGLRASQPDAQRFSLPEAETGGNPKGFDNLPCGLPEAGQSRLKLRPYR